MQPVRRILKWLFAGYFRRRELKEKAKTDRLEQKLFSDKAIGSVYRHLRIRRRGGSGKWVIRTDNRLDACLLFNILPSAGERSVRNTATRIITSVRIDRNSSLVLTEYLFPHRVRMIRPDEREVLFARATLRMGKRENEAVSFYAAESVTECDWG